MVDHHNAVIVEEEVVDAQIAVQWAPRLCKGRVEVRSGSLAPAASLIAVRGHPAEILKDPQSGVLVFVRCGRRSVRRPRSPWGRGSLDRMPRRLVAIAVVAVLAVSSCSGGGSEPELSGETPTSSSPDGSQSASSAPSGADAEVAVDLSAPRPERSRFGVLHWNAIEGVPTGLVDPLRPTVLRTPFVAEEVESQLERFDTVNLLLSDSYGYPPSWPVPPYVDSEQWVALVQSVLDDPLIVETMAESPDRLIFEPWNEPDMTPFWDGTRDQFTDAWLETEAIIRDTYPDAQVGGPSYALYEPGAITTFLDRCATAGCRLDYLIWHGFQVDLPSFRADIDESDELITGGDYDALGIRGLLVNEYPLVTLDLLPAENLGFLEAFEDGDLFGSARACWGGSHVLADALAGGSWTNCGAGRLNGFLTPPPDSEPRAVWWVYERFAAGLEGRVETSASDPDHVTAVGSAGDDSASVLVGHLDDVELEDPEASRPPIDIAVSIGGIDGSCAGVTTRAIPDSRDEPVLELPQVASDIYRIVEGTHHVLLEGVPAHEVRVIELSIIDC